MNDKGIGIVEIMLVIAVIAVVIRVAMPIVLGG